jgi:hypothetical protein
VEYLDNPFPLVHIIHNVWERGDCYKLFAFGDILNLKVIKIWRMVNVKSMEDLTKLTNLCVVERVINNTSAMELIDGLSFHLLARP